MRLYLTTEEAEQCHEAAAAVSRREHPEWFGEECSLVGTTFCHDNQPYGAVYFTVERATLVPVPPEEEGEYRHLRSSDYLRYRAASAWWELHGTVTKGGVVSRLFHHRAHRSLIGEQYTHMAPPSAVAKGRHVTVAM